MSVDTPNLVIPLASSYNERGIAGFANTFTGGIDQRKINSFYEPIKNAVTGVATLELVNRPGVTKSASTHGTSGQVAYLIIGAAGQSGISALPWVISKASNDIRASSSAATTVIVNSATHIPAYVDKTLISGTEYVVLQTQVDQNTAQRAFYSSAIASWTEITDSDFTGLVHAGKMEFMDGWAFILDNMNRVSNSDINSLGSWTAGNFITKQIKQDYPRGLAKLGQRIIAFGDETMEVFVNGGNPSGSPLQVVKDAFQRYGLIGTYVGNPGVTNYYATLGARMYFIGRQAGGSYSVGLFAYNGSTVEKVSTPNIDKILASLPNYNAYSVVSVGFNGKEAIAIAIDAQSATTQRWLMFFPEWNDWFEWNSTVFMPMNASEFFLGVGTNQHKVYFFNNTDNWQDDGTDYVMTHQFKLPKKDTARAFMSMCGVKGDTARVASTLNVEFSDDDWQTFQSARAIDMTKIKKQLTRCGSYFDRGVRLTHTGNSECRIESFFARVE